MKYLIMVNKHTKYTDVMVFGDDIVHRDAARSIGKTHVLYSAGFVGKQDGKWFCFGESESLKVKSKSSDVDIVAPFLEQGLSGLQLQNAIVYEQLRRLK